MNLMNHPRLSDRTREVGQVFDLPFERLSGCEGGSKTRPTPSLRRLLALSVLLAAAARAEVLVERTIMPLGAGPSSFAIGLPGGMNFCFDAVRGGLDYAWTGGFVDLTNVRPGLGKLITPVKLLGPVVYQEHGPASLRRGDPTRVPVVEFRGYTLRDASVEFRYTVDGILVREEITARAGSPGLTRRFTIEAAGADSRWWHVIEGQPATELSRDASGAFVLEHVFKTAAP